MTRGALRQELDKRGLDTDGPRPTLIDRLTQALSQEELECNDSHYKTELGSISERSVSSVRSKASSLASCRALTSAKLAGLKARAASLKKKHELDKQAVELQARREDLDLEMELGEALARQATFTKIGFSDGVGITGELINATEPQVDDNTGTARKTCRATVDELSVRAGSSNHLGSNQGDVRKIDPTHDHVTRLHLPTLEFSTFKGNNEHYPSFMRAFQTNIASRLSNEEEKLHYLLQYTADKPRDIVSTCLYLPPEQGYKEAKRLLDRRYGNFAQMAVSLVGTILEYPIIKSEDVEGLDSFAIHLRGSLNALKSLPHGAGSVDVKTIRALVDKVPYHMKEKWRRVVDGIEQTSFRQATFEDFVDFVEVEARIATNPSYGRIMLGAGSAKGKSRERRSEHVQVAGVSSGKLFAGNLKDPTRVSNTCLCCSQEHETHECPELLAKTPEDKNRFIFENHLCFGCLTANHVFRFCKNKKKCQVCGGSHATVLHRDQQRPRSPTVTSGHVAPIYQGGAKLQAVAVRITVCGNSLTTYAFLDSGSTHSFICAPLLRALGISPITNTSITLSTISKDEKIDSCVIPHLWIESLDGAFRMELPPLFVLDKIPISRRDTPGEDDLKRWSYLKESGVTLEDRVDGEVGLLIGSNAAAVMEPLQVVPGQGGGPYAIRTRFGWFLGGVPKFSKVFKINQTKLTIDDDTFGNRADTRKGYSVEDREWHFKVESSCHLKKGQYELELPFRHREPRLPNNRNVAERRLGLLKRKMQKQPEFAVAYNKQIEELVVKGYVERATGQVQNTDHIWYLPHQGVRHPAKPHKLIIVFDCASRFKGISLNDELLQGPDLTNTMVDVLLRFRQDKIAFMADIESMFLRVRVPQHQRDYLRFLWWTDGDPEAPIQEYRATSHLFGAVSSPSCANYALRRTARDFGNCYDSKVALTIDRNFYVDDALVSVATDEDAISLALSVRELCSRGGFKLTKFSSNGVAVLQAIPKEDRAAQVRDLNLGSDYLPADRALGVYWDVQTDSLGFDVDVDSFHRRPVTRRGILSATAAFYDPFGIASPFVIRARILLQELTRLKLGWDESVPIKYSKVMDQVAAGLASFGQVPGTKNCLRWWNVSSSPSGAASFFRRQRERLWGGDVRSINQ